MYKSLIWKGLISKHEIFGKFCENQVHMIGQLFVPFFFIKVRRSVNTHQRVSSIN
jgi:Kef-type K+ transport system membrane component KefB